jgi:hypothetical protein
LVIGFCNSVEEETPVSDDFFTIDMILD